MKVTLYKILAIRNAFEKLQILAIPMEDDDIEIQKIIALLIVGLADRKDDFNALINSISDEAKEWDNNLDDAIKVLSDFFALIPAELNVLMKQLTYADSMLKELVGQSLKEEQQKELIADLQE